MQVARRWCFPLPPPFCAVLVNMAGWERESYSVLRRPDPGRPIPEAALLLLAVRYRPHVNDNIDFF